ncbi:MAG: Mur ligase family protein [Candidatus Nomurabacteria bacterium]|nr:Mur ligase family protein [Candidatus Nomurabacteria bacterium]
MQKKAKLYYEEKKKKLPDYQQRNVTESILDINEIKNIHLTGICGTAMGSLAKLFRDANYEVTGSDKTCYPPMDQIIANLGINISSDFNEQNLNKKDLIIIANMFGPDNIEAKYSRENNLPELSMPEAIRQFFINSKESIVIAGTHGKTTTTGIMVHVFKEGETNPSYLIGGVLKDSKDSAFYNKESKHFIIEGDEYDTSYFDKSPKFLHYMPKTAIITSVELDHIDIYNDIEDYRNAFKFLIDEVADDGHIFICGEDSGANSLKEEYIDNEKILQYGFSENFDLYAKDINIKDDYQEFKVFFKGKDYGIFLTPLFGKYNILNCLAVIGTSLTYGLEIESIKKGIYSFSGMKRRQEVFADKNGIILIDDFAHHPTAVEKTLNGIKDKYSGHRIIAVFEPRSNSSRSKIFEEEYKKSFSSADIVIISTPKHKEGYIPDDLMDTTKVVDEISKTKQAFCVNGADEAVKILKGTIKEKDIVVVMSNGSFDGIHEKISNII